MGEPTRLLDVNVLVALTQTAHVHHDAAHAWFSARAGSTPWATCPMTEAAFVRLLANPAVSGTPTSVAQAVSALAVIRARAGHRFLKDPTSLAHSELDLTALRGHQQVTDFHLLNLCAASNAVLLTFDIRIAQSLMPANRHLVELVPPA